MESRLKMGMELEMNGTEPVGRNVYVPDAKGTGQGNEEGIAGEENGRGGKKRVRTAKTVKKSRGAKGFLTREQAVYRAQEAAGSRYSDRQLQGLDHTGSRYSDKSTPLRLEQRQTAAVTRKSLAESITSLAQAWWTGLRTGRIPAIVATVLMGVLAASYIYAGVYYSRHFYPNTHIYGIDCSNMTVADAKEAVAMRVQHYSLDLLERDQAQDTISAQMIGLKYLDDQGIDKAMKAQKSPIWPVMMLLGKTQVEVHTQYSENSIDDVLHGLSAFQEQNIVHPQDARLGETDEGYVIVPEVMGNELNFDAVKSAVTEALKNGSQSISLEESECYKSPEIYSDDAGLHEEMDRLNPLMGAKVTLDFGDRSEVVGTSVIRDFISHYQSGEYFVDPEKVYDYVEQLAYKYDTYGGYRTFYTTIGTVEELYGGDYGWMMDPTSTTQLLLEAIRNKQVETIEPYYVHTAMDRNINDIGDTYVEICISRQEMWVYQDGHLVVDTPVVTGNPSVDKATPSGGVWSIDGKFENYTLVGDDYRCPVEFWLPFNEDVGIHDLSNRYYYGGEIYLYAGSHGCVNTPLAAVEQVYNAVSVGTPVIVYE